MNAKLKLVHEAEAQRQHVRIRIPLQAVVEDVSYNVVDLSVAGMCFEAVGLATKVGDTLGVKLVFAFEGFEFIQAMKIEVVNVNATTGRTGCRFIDITESQLSMLHFVVDAYLSGEVIAASDVIEIPKRNMFMAQRKIPAPELPANRFAAAAVGVRRKVVAGALVVAGLAVFAYAGLAIYAHAYVTDGKGVVVTQEVQFARAPISGTITPQSSAKGKRVAEKELIAVIESPTGAFKQVEASCDCLLANEPLAKGSFVARGTIIARLVPPTAQTQVEVHLPLERLEGIEKHQRVRVDLYSGQPSAWGTVDRVDRHTPIGSSVSVSDTSYGVVMVNLDAPMPAEAVGEPAAVQIHRLNWLSRWAAPKSASGT